VSEHIGIFVAWPYANGKLHLGHIAGAYLPADIFARFNRLNGRKVLMVSGSDTHGTPITLKAKQENKTPMEVVETYHQSFLEGWKKLGVTFDLFTHTHTKNHIKISQDFFSQMHENGDLEVKEQEQFYDEEAKMFLPDRYVHGTCPKCGYDRARGDQCESCGATFDAHELLEPVSKITDTRPVLKPTSHFFFDMSRYQDKLADFIEEKDFWRPHVKNYTKSAIENGLKQRPITRDIDWGVPVPVEGWEGKVLYVWFDAVIGYYSASVEKRPVIDEGADAEDWRSWWCNEDARGYYFIGKDNVPFHSVIWPIELMAFNPDLNLPYDVPANQFLNMDGEKFSTSRGLAVWLDDVLEKFDVDSVRYNVAAIMPETKDSNFTWEGFALRNNGELVAAWGNLVNRVLGFTASKFDGQVPEPGELRTEDKELLESVKVGFEKVTDLYEKVNLRDALKEAIAVSRDVNKYINDMAPWHQIKEDRQAAATTIFVALQAIDTLKIMLAPVLPNSSEKIHSYFGYSEPLFGDLEINKKAPEGEDAYNVLEYQPTERERSGENVWKISELKPGGKISKPKPLFQMIDDEVAAAD
jgi:methionyl-tRNA synthetase